MAYQNPIITSKEITNAGVRIFVEAVGDAGEETIRAERLITPKTTIQEVREWAWRLVNEEGPGRQTIADAITVNTPIPPLQPAPPPGPTPRQVWVDKAERLIRAKEAASAGLNAAAATADIATLEADVNATYQAGFIA